MDAMFGAFALVEGFGWSAGSEAGQGGHVEDPAQGAVVAPGAAPVAADAAGVFGDGNQPGVGGEPSWCAEGGLDVAAGGSEEFCAQQGAHAGQALDDRGLGMGAEPAGDELAGVLDLAVQVQQLAGEL